MSKTKDPASEGHEGIFTSDDVNILSHAVSLHSNLEYACLATKLARKHITFPITGYDQIDKLFGMEGLPEKITKRKIGSPHLRKFFPKEFFPVEDEKDFLGKVLGALSWGDTVHYHERFLKNPERFNPVGHRTEKE